MVHGLSAMAAAPGEAGSAPEAAADGAKVAGEAALVASGVTRPTYNALLSFMLPGVVEEIFVSPGQAVRTGDPLLRLDDRAETHRLAALEREIANTIPIRTLRARIGQALLDKERYASAFARGAATEMEMQHAALAYDLSRLALEEEEFRLEQLRHSREELLAVLERMRLLAPQDGHVEDILVERGMIVDRNVQALRLMAVDPMWIEMNLPLGTALRLESGRAVEILRPGGAPPLAGAVAHISRTAVLSSRSLRVRVKSPNPDLVPAGLLIRVRFPGLAANGGAGRDAAPDFDSDFDYISASP